MGLWSTSKQLASLWAAEKKRQLREHGTPSTRVDSGGTQRSHTWNNQDIDRDTLREIRDVRESAAIVAQLVHAKALMQFGTGVEFQTESDDLKEWLREEFPHIDNQLIELGEDAIWFPYSLAEIVETRGGDFSHVEAVEPWTTLPVENEFGEVVAWEQEISGDYGMSAESYQPGELASFVLNKSSARDNTGVSEVKRAEEEIDAFVENRRAVQNAVDRASYRRHWWKVGREGAGVIDDNELRRVRNRVTDLESDTVLVTGQDVEHELMDAMNPERFKAIREMDMRDMALALGVPIELASVISEGLGSGEQSGVRMQAFILEARAAQRNLGDQFTREVLKPVVEQYSPYNADDLTGLKFGEPLSEEEDLSVKADYMTTNEIRSELDLPREDDEELGDSYRKPANVEAPDEEPATEDGGIGGLFSEGEEGNADSRHAQDIEDIATDDYPDAAVENARMALEAREETGDPNDCGTRVGWERANQLVNGEALSEETISRMAAFERHEDNKEQGEEGRADCGWMMWKAWGGDEGIAWAEDKLEEFEEAREARALSGDAPEFDQPYLRIFEDRIWNDQAGDKALVAFNESEVPEMVLERLKDAVRGGAIFSDFDSIPSSELMELRELFADNLGSEGWSLRDLAGEIEERFGVTEARAENIARSEVASTVNSAREVAYEERDDDRDYKFQWVGPDPDNHRTTDCCEWIMKETNPDYGGTPQSMKDLKEKIQEGPKHDPDMDDNLAREWIPHPQCRHTYTRYVE